MAESSSRQKPFDPYHKWLGIPPSEQPPNHYRLLGLEHFEEDLDVIDTAADRAMSFLQQCATGDQIEASQKLLNEVSQARVRLLNAKHKRAYDEKLKKSLFKNIVAENEEPLPAFEVERESVASRVKKRSKSKRSKPRRRNSDQLKIVIAGGVLVVFGLLVWAVLPKDNTSAESANRGDLAENKTGKTGNAGQPHVAQVDRRTEFVRPSTRTRRATKSVRPTVKRPPRNPQPRNPQPLDAGPPPANVNLDAGLVGYYTFENGLDDQLVDASGQGFDGRSIGGKGSTGGRHGKGLPIGQSGESHFPDAGDFEFNQPFSLSLWFLSGRSGLLLSRQQPPPGQKGYELGLREGDVFFSLIADPASGNLTRVQTDLGLDRPGWHLLSVTYDGSGESQGMSVFLDGKRLETQKFPRNVTKSIRSEGLIFKIGKNESRPAAGGIVDDVLIYNRVLKNEEIAYLARHGQPTSRIPPAVAAKPKRSEKTPRNPTVAKPSPENAAELAALNRRVAQWMQGRVGSTQIRKTSDRRTQNVGGKSPLPDEPFDVVSITMAQGNPIPSDAEFQDLASLTELEKLNFLGTPLSSSGLKYLSNSRSLKELDIRGWSVQDEDCRSIGNCGSIKKLVLSAADITDDGLSALGELESLEFLRFTEAPRITGAGFEKFAGRELKTLELFGTNINDDALDAIANFRKLKTLKLSDAPITDAGMKRIQSMTGLISLDLSGTQVTDEGLLLLSNLVGLTVLDLHSTAIGDAGIQVVSRMPKLVYLHLDQTKVTAQPLVLLKDCPNLNVMTLSNLPIGDDDLKHLKTLDKLFRLSLDGTNVSNDGITQLASLPTLCYLSVKGTSVTRAAATDLEKFAIEIRKSNRRLRISCDD